MGPERTTGWKRLTIAFALTGLVGACLLLPLPSDWNGIWHGKLLDLGHVPLFGGLTYLLWLLLGPSFLWPIVISLTEAGLAEMVQACLDRSAEVADFARGVVGTFAAVLVIQAWRTRHRPVRAGACLLGVLGLLAWPVVDLGPYLLDAYEGFRAFPVLAEFRSDRELLRWQYRQASLSRLENDERSGARLEFLDGPAKYRYAALYPVVRDFGSYKQLCCSFTVESEALNLVISVRDNPDDDGRSAHFQVSRTFARGSHVATLDLERLAPEAFPRPLQLSDVWFIQLFLVNRTGVIQLHRIWLEE